MKKIFTTLLFIGNLIIVLLSVSVLCISQDKQEKRPSESTNITSVACPSTVIGCNLFSSLLPSSLVFSNASISYNGPVGQSCLDGASGTNWGCIGGRPNQTWFYITAQTSGNLIFRFTFTVNSGSPSYVDGIIWGPVTTNILTERTCLASYQNQP